MLQNNEKNSRGIKGRERLWSRQRQGLQKLRERQVSRSAKEENQHKYMMGGIVHKYFPECYQFDEQELNRIIASGMKSEQLSKRIY